IKQILAQLKNLNPKQVHMVFGAVNDKDITTILALLPKTYRYYFCQAVIPRALDVQELRQKADQIGLSAGIYTSVAEAITAAKAKAEPDEDILMGGSTLVVAEVEEL